MRKGMRDIRERKKSSTKSLRLPDLVALQGVVCRGSHPCGIVDLRLSRPL